MERERDSDDHVTGECIVYPHFPGSVLACRNTRSSALSYIPQCSPSGIAKASCISTVGRHIKLLTVRC